MKGTTEVKIGLRSVCWTIPFYRTCGFPGHLLCWDDLFSFLIALPSSTIPFPTEMDSLLSGNSGLALG